ncbi:hypothetical protein TNCV_3500181 [Trichonephila clavipes]|nr:hypothetical protein TNCV_3500181 [Trichonephila clavipes]
MNEKRWCKAKVDCEVNKNSVFLKCTPGKIEHSFKRLGTALRSTVKDCRAQGDEKRKRDEREEPGLGWRKGKSPGWNGREESAKEKGLVRDWSGKTMNAGGVENRL